MHRHRSSECSSEIRAPSHNTLPKLQPTQNRSQRPALTHTWHGGCEAGAPLTSCWMECSNAHAWRLRMLMQMRAGVQKGLLKAASYPNRVRLTQRPAFTRVGLSDLVWRIACCCPELKNTAIHDESCPTTPDQRRVHYWEWRHKI